MKNLLHELYYGKIIPCERRSRNKEELQEIVRKIGEEEKYLTSKMSPDDCVRFDNLSDLYYKLSDMEEYEVFAYSFSMGARFMLDILDEAGAMDLNNNRESGKEVNEP